MAKRRYRENEGNGNRRGVSGIDAVRFLAGDQSAGEPFRVVVSNDTANLVEQRVKSVTCCARKSDGLSSEVDDPEQTLNSESGDDSQDGEVMWRRQRMLPAVEGPGLVKCFDDSPL